MKSVKLKQDRGNFVIEIPVILRIPVLMDVVRRKVPWLAGVNLTRKEREVLDGILAEMLNKEIAGQMNVQERTVKWHVANVLQKFQVRNRIELRNLFDGGKR